MNWYCVHTKPQREQIAADQLSTSLGLEVYLPTIRLHKTIRRVRRQVVEPLFPRYFFSRFNLATDFRAVRYAHDVIDIVSFGAQPALVDDQLVEQIRAWSSTHVVQKNADDLSSGDHVQITFGPMQGLHAVILDSHNDRERVAVLLSILGRDTRVTIDRSLLAKAV
jgi:transcriptional antiterminator RfaH